MATKKAPRVSVVLPTYNRAALLRRAIQSVIDQSFTDWELLVINDASTDNTKQLVDDWAKKDERIRPVHNAKNNYPDISKNLNNGLMIARGEYIARIDDDDYWNNLEKLRKQVEFLDSHPDHVIVGGGTIVIDESDNERFRYFKLETDEEIRRSALFANPFTHSTVMFRRKAALDAGGYASFGNTEDWDLWLRMGLRGKFYNFQEYFVRYLMTERSKTFVFKRSQSRDNLKALMAHRGEYPNFIPAFLLNVAQYCYSLLPLGVRSALHNSLSRAKRSLFSGS